MKPRAALLTLLLAGVAWPGADSGWAVTGDIVFEREDNTRAFAPAVFPHWLHRARFRCYVCHAQIFEMKRGANEITMQKIRQGDFCGKCHNGKAAFNVDIQTCIRCHQATTDAKPGGDQQ